MERLKTLLSESRLPTAKFARLACFMLLAFASFWFFSFTLPVLTGDYDSASRSWVGDTASASYDAALVRYANGQYDDSIRLLTDAYNQLLSENGEIKPERKALAGQIKFLNANALVKTKKLNGAIDAYKEALRLNPQHMYAKYNLEMLLQMNGGKGPGADPQDPGGSGSGRPDRKGI